MHVDSQDIFYNEILDMQRKNFSANKERIEIEAIKIPLMQYTLIDYTDSYFSTVLNACGASLPLVRLKQNFSHYFQILWNIIEKDDCADEILAVGSYAEGITDLGFEHSDVDGISIVGNFKIYEHKNEEDFVKSSDLTFDPVLRLPDKTYTGYAKLEVLKENDLYREFYHFEGGRIFLKNTFKEGLLNNSKYFKIDNISIHGPAVNAKFRLRDLASLCRLAGFRAPDNVVDFEIDKNNDIGDTDLVYCLSGKEWPDEADEWKTRTRYSKWPTKVLFDDVIKSGYILAGVGSKESNESDIQWRVSFNRAEQLIIESLNETQIHCLCLLKCYKTRQLSEVAGKSITSYTMKTVIFWCLEETSREFWQSKNLVSCICFCMTKLKHFVEKGFLPNYFIRERNQLYCKEFTHEIQTKATQCLQCFLDDPHTGISKLVSEYIEYEIAELDEIYQHWFIAEWLLIRVCMAQKYHAIRMHIYKLFDGKDTKNRLYRCNNILQKLTGHYVQPFIKLFQNVIDVLHFVIPKEKKETCRDIPNSNERTQYSKHMKSSLEKQNSHTNLRTATNYLHDDVKGDCLDIIRTVTNHPGNYIAMINYNSEHVKQTLKSTTEAFLNISSIFEVHGIAMYKEIIEQDLIDQDPYRTIQNIEQIMRKGHTLDLLNTYLLLWDQCRFDVTFMPAELQVLPKPAARELCIDNSQKYISFHPYLYGLLLEFLWHAKYSSTNEETEKVLDNMKDFVLIMQNEQQPRGLNFITYCCLLQKDYLSASRYLIQSFKLNPVEQNVAYLYIKCIIRLLLSLFCD